MNTPMYTTTPMMPQPVNQGAVGMSDPLSMLPPFAPVVQELRMKRGNIMMLNCLLCCCACPLFFLHGFGYLTAIVVCCFGLYGVWKARADDIPTLKLRIIPTSALLVTIAILAIASTDFVDTCAREGGPVDYCHWRIALVFLSQLVFVAACCGGMWWLCRDWEKTHVRAMSLGNSQQGKLRQHGLLN